MNKKLTISKDVLIKVCIEISGENQQWDQPACFIVQSYLEMVKEIAVLQHYLLEQRYTKT